MHDAKMILKLEEQKYAHWFWSKYGIFNVPPTKRQ